MLHFKHIPQQSLYGSEHCPKATKDEQMKDQAKKIINATRVIYIGSGEDFCPSRWEEFNAKAN